MNKIDDYVNFGLILFRVLIKQLKNPAEIWLGTNPLEHNPTLVLLCSF